MGREAFRGLSVISLRTPFVRPSISEVSCRSENAFRGKNLRAVVYVQENVHDQVLCV